MEATMVGFEKMQSGNLKMIVTNHKLFEIFIRDMIDEGYISINKDSQGNIIDVSGNIEIGQILQMDDINCINWVDITGKFSLTETDALTDDFELTDDGDGITFGNYYFDPYYQIRPYWLMLLRNGECEFQKGD